MAALDRCAKFLLKCFTISNEEFVKELKENYSDDNAVIELILKGLVEVRKSVLQDILNELMKDDLGNVVCHSEHEIRPEDCDGTNNDAFYYAIRTGSVELVRTLMYCWPGGLPAGILEKLLSKACEKVRLRNLALPERMELFLVDELTGMRFFSSGDTVANGTLEGITKRILLVEEQVSILEKECNSNKLEDCLFVFVGKSILHNLHILKQQLRATYDRIPWEEMEYCLAVFILSQVKEHEINIYISLNLNKTKIIRYLVVFVRMLGEVKNKVETNAICDLTKLPKIERAIIVNNIIECHPELIKLYNDFQIVRDIHSLLNIELSITELVKADALSGSGKLEISRGLQIIGEHLKCTLESPKLSVDTSKILVDSLPKNSKKMIVEIRDALSHTHSLSARKGIPSLVFSRVQSDVQEVGFVVRSILRKKQFAVARLVLETIAISQNESDVRKAVYSFFKMDHRIIFDLREMTVLNMFKKFINYVEKNIEKSDHEESIFKRLKATIENTNIQHSSYLNVMLNSVKGLSSWTSACQFPFDNSLVKNISKICMKILATIDETDNRFSDILGLPEVREVVLWISRLKPEKASEAKRLVNICYITGFNDVQKIQKFKNIFKNIKSPKYKKKKDMHQYKKEDHYSVENKILELRRIIGKYNELRCLKSLKNVNYSISASENNSWDLEMILIDILSILGSEKHLEHNFLFSDDSSPLLIGKNLRNHLAHDNITSHFLLAHPSVSLFVHAKRLSQIQNFLTAKIGKVVIEDIEKLWKNFKHSVNDIRNIEHTIECIKDGKPEDFYEVPDNVDISSRIYNCRSLLHFASMGMSVETVKYLVSRKVDVDSVDSSGQSPLHVAAAHGRSEIVSYLVQVGGADVLAKDNLGRTPLHLAAQSGSVESVTVLINQNITSISIPCFIGFLPLHHALFCNRIQVFELLIENDPLFDVNEMFHSVTLLHFSVIHGYKELTDVILKYQKDINVHCIDGNTPLHYAVISNQYDIVHYLVMKGADVNISNNEDLKPLYYASFFGNIESVELLLNYVNNVDGGQSALIGAVFFSQPDLVKALLERGACINAKNASGCTPLHLALFYKNQPASELLIQFGADINSKNEIGQTPLHIASYQELVSLTTTIIEQGGAVNSASNGTLSPLQCACYRGNTEIVKILLNNNAEINIGDKWNSPLGAAILSGSNGTIEVLIENKVNLIDDEDFDYVGSSILLGKKDLLNLFIKNNCTIKNKHLLLARHKEILEVIIDKINDIYWSGKALYMSLKNKYPEDVVEMLLQKITGEIPKGYELLRFASFLGYKKIVSSLLSRGVKLDDGKEEQTPLYLAACGGFEDVVEILLSKNAEINARDRLGRTPLYAAAEKGNDSIVSTLLRKGSDINIHAFQREFNKDVELALGSKFVNMSYGISPLFIAIMMGQSSVMNILMEIEGKYKSKDYIEQTLPLPIIAAISKSHLEVARLFLSKLTFEINNKYNEGNSLIHFSAMQNEVEIIELLLEYGADINSNNNSGENPLQISAQYCCINSLKFFIEKLGGIKNVKRNHLLHFVIKKETLKNKKKQVDVIKYLLGEGWDVNDVGDYGTTPLHMAAKNGNVQALQLFLEGGAVFNAIDNFGRTPLDMTEQDNIRNILIATKELFAAVNADKLSTVKELLKNGAVVNSKNKHKETVLHIAALKSCYNLRELLLLGGADPKTPDDVGFTPLHYAAKTSCYNTFDFLVNGAVYNQPSHSGKTPFNLATDERIKSLLQVVDDAFVKCRRGELRITDLMNIFETNEPLVHCACGRKKCMSVLTKNCNSYILCNAVLMARQVNIQNGLNETISELALTSGQDRLLNEIEGFSDHWNRMQKFLSRKSIVIYLQE